MTEYKKRKEFLTKILMKKTRSGYWKQRGYREGPRKCHIVLEEHRHNWTPDHQPITTLDQDEEKSIEDLFVTFTATSVTLHRGYSWNGSNYVGDTPATLRASALHDAWWQAMEAGIYECESRENADKEYIFICQEDGLKATFHKIGFSIGRKLNFPSCR